MKKNLLNYLIFSFLMLIVGIVGVKALPNVTLDKDIITASEPSAAGFFINNSSSYNTSSYFNDPDFGGINVSNKKSMVSVKNGTYYVWSLPVSSGNLSGSTKVVVSNSCDNESRTKQTGTFTVERCFYKVSGSNEILADDEGTTIASCASGYKVTSSSVITDTCSNLSLNGLSKRYCKRVFKFTCTKVENKDEEDPKEEEKPVVAAATLSSLSLDGATISPSFKASTKKYKATVAANVSSIKVNAKASKGNSLVSGYGSRTVKLSYGSNTIKVKVKNSAGSVVTYSIVVTRKDNRSSVNTLSNLTVSAGTLSPAFSSDVTSYKVSVGNEVTSLNVNATLTDSNSKFASGFGPRSVSLDEGVNQVYIKVTSQKNVTKTYTITVTRGAVSSSCSLQEGELALLKGIDVKADDTTPIVIEGFDPLKKDYEGITVPYNVKHLTVFALLQDESDTYKVENANDLEVNIPREIKITVTSKACPAYSSIYTLYVTRLPEEVEDSVADLKNITIKGYDDFKFEKNKLNYGIELKTGDKSLDITYEKEKPTTNCVIEGNEDLKINSEITITCTSEDGVDVVQYKITVDRVKKKANVFLLILFVIIIILIIIYIIMRLLGYKIYFNFDALKAAFGGKGEDNK